MYVCMYVCMYEPSPAKTNLTHFFFIFLFFCRFIYLVICGITLHSFTNIHNALAELCSSEDDQVQIEKQENLRLET